MPVQPSAFALTGRDTYAFMVLCAGDATTIFDQFKAQNPTGNPTLPNAGDGGFSYLKGPNWEIVGQLRADDDIVTNQSNCYFGVFLRCTAAFGPFKVNDLVVAVKGTSDVLEWVDDGASLFPTDPEPGEPGDVALGFWRVYQTLDFADWTNGTNRSPLVARIVAEASKASFDATANRVFVVGHSLGAALATYLAYDLWQAMPAPLKGTIAPYFFASPKTGVASNVTHYATVVASYNLANYQNDLVPQLPFAQLGYCALLNLGSQQNSIVLQPAGQPWIPGVLDVGHNHSTVLYARLLDPNNGEALRRTI